MATPESSRKVRPPRRHIVALGGGGFSMEAANPLLDDFILGLCARARPRICFVPTGSGDSAEYIANFHQAFAGRAEATHLRLFRRAVDDLDGFIGAQDIIYVGGGNTANLLAVWRVHGLDRILRAAWQRGTVLAGISAGALCWFDGGVTDSFGKLAALDDGLALVSGSFCPHFDGEAQRRPRYHDLIKRKQLAAGLAADDGAALHFVGTSLAEVVTSRPNAAAYRVGRSGTETKLPARFLGEHQKPA